MRLSRRVANLATYGLVRALSSSESRQARREYRKLTLARASQVVMFGAMVVLMLMVKGASFEWTWFVPSVIVSGGLALVAGRVVLAGQFETVSRGHQGLALLVRDWPEPVTDEIDPTVGVYINDAEMVTLNSDGTARLTEPRPELRFDVTPRRGFVRRIWIGDESWPAVEVPM